MLISTTEGRSNMLFQLKCLQRCCIESVAESLDKIGDEAITVMFLFSIVLEVYFIYGYMSQLLVFH